VIAVSTCSTGAPGHGTPTGHPAEARRTLFQHIQQCADAEHATTDLARYALHVGHLPDYRKSKGCIRLPLELSRLLFSVTGLSASAIIADQTGAHSSVVQPGLMLPNDVATDARTTEDKTRRTKSRAADKSMSRKDLASTQKAARLQIYGQTLFWGASIILMVPASSKLPGRSNPEQPWSSPTSRRALICDCATLRAS
jgi:hypothetical protein